MRSDGRPTAGALRLLRDRLAPLEPAEVDRLCCWLLPLLIDLGMLAPHGSSAVTGPAATRFLAQPPVERLRILTDAWVGAPRPDRWLTPLRVNTRGLDWPALRRRLLAWAAALPPEAPVEPQRNFLLLQAALGPLADTTTHGFCVSLRRAPWLPRRAAEVWEAACRGPLVWLGAVETAPMQNAECRIQSADHGVLTFSAADADQVCSIPIGIGAGGEALSLSSAGVGTGAPDNWYVTSEETIVAPRGVGDADQLVLAPFAQAVEATAAGEQFRLSVASVTAAATRGHDPARLREVLERRCGALTSELEGVLSPSGGLRMWARTVLLSDEPADLAAALRRRSVRRAVDEVLAPGVALVAPGGEAALSRALARDGRAVTAPPAADVSPPSELTAGEQASLLVVCAHYRATAPEGAPPGPHDGLLERLRVGLPPALAAAADKAIVALASSTNAECRMQNVACRAALLDDLSRHGECGTLNPTCYPQDEPGAGDGQPLVTAEDLPSEALPLAELLDRLRSALRRRQAVTLWYQGADDTVLRKRTVRPIRLEQHGPWWYLHTYCLAARAERCFRLDRVRGLTAAVNTPRPKRPRKRAAAPERPPRGAPKRPRSTPRAGFFAAPPAPPPGSPLVGVWLDEG